MSPFIHCEPNSKISFIVLYFLTWYLNTVFCLSLSGCFTCMSSDLTVLHLYKLWPLCFTCTSSDLTVLHLYELWPHCVSPVRALTSLCFTCTSSDLTVLHLYELWPHCASPVRALTSLCFTCTSSDLTVLHLYELWPHCASPVRALTSLCFTCTSSDLTVRVSLSEWVGSGPRSLCVCAVYENWFVKFPVREKYARHAQPTGGVRRLETNTKKQTVF